jgi:C-terminal processing protease CtpA/Prc
MHRTRASVIALCAAAVLLTSCGAGSNGLTAAPGPTPTPTPTPTAQCSLRERQLWAEAQIREWYLFPEDLPASIDPGQYASVDAFINALTATARAAGKDRFFTYLTSIAEENAFNSQGQTAAFGIRLRYDDAARRVFVIDAFETGPAFAAGLDRGAELLAIGTAAANLQSVSSLMASGGSAAVSDALGPSEAGVTRAIQYRIGGATNTVTITRAVFNIPPVSSRFGVQTIPDGSGGQVGYVNLRTFISSAETPLRNAFAGFRAAGVTRVIIDYRYNSGGLVRVAELSGDLLGRSRLASDVFSFTTFRPSKSVENETRLFRSTPESIAPTALAFITTSSSASASELVINAMLPYLGNNLTMVGANTSGKPVGQIALDRTACDDRLRIIAFATQNRDRQGDYFNGLAPLIEPRGGRTCQAGDDPAFPMGNPSEASTAAAIGALRGGLCVPIGGVATLRTAGAAAPAGGLLASRAPNAAQREMQGLF